MVEGNLQTMNTTTSRSAIRETRLQEVKVKLQGLRQRIENLENEISHLHWSGDPYEDISKYRVTIREMEDEIFALRVHLRHIL